MSGGEIVDLPLAQVYPGPLVRRERLDLDHVALLRGLDNLPPIDVRKTAKGYECLDGAHRSAARRQDECETIRGVVLELDDAEALEHAYLANNRHGLPLTLAERKAGARRFISETTLSDASIAKVVGLSRTTVAALRPVQPAQNDMLDGKRRGADGKSRPGDKAAQEALRAEVRKLLTEHPDLSLNEIARRAGCSAVTAAKVREAMAKAEPQGELPPPPAAPTPDPAASSAGEGQEDGSGVERPPRSLGAVPPRADSAPTVGEVLDHCPAPGTWAKADGMSVSNAAQAAAKFLDRRLPRTDDDPAALAARIPAPRRAEAAFAARLARDFWAAVEADLSNPTRLASVEEA